MMFKDLRQIRQEFRKLIKPPQKPKQRQKKVFLFFFWVEEKGLIVFGAIAISSKFSPQKLIFFFFQTRFPNPKKK